MQVLKNEVRESIRTAAINTFKEKGYRNASMREIALTSKMSVGNLYRYFKNKEELFAYLVKPLIEMFEKANVSENQEFKGDLLDVNFLEHSAIMDLMVNSRALYREELFILFLRAEASPFDGASHNFKEFLEGQIEKFVSKNLGATEFFKGRLLSKYLASSIVDTFCVILEEAKDDEEFILNMMEYSEYFIKPAIRNLMAVKNGEVNFRRISDEEVHRRFGGHCNHRSNSSAESD